MTEILMAEARGENPVMPADFSAHLESCPECQAEMHAMSALWHRMGDLPTPEPGYGLDARWRSTLQVLVDEADRRPIPQTRSWTFPWPQRPLWQGAIAFATLIIGLTAGVAVSRRPARAPDRDEVAKLREEVAGMREMVALSLLRQDSASERLRGVDYGGRVAAVDPEVAAALVEAVRHDPSVNVRLAAIDALSKTAGRAGGNEIVSSLAHALPNEESPMVQAALVDYLVDARDRQAIGTIEALAARPDLNPAVRERARFALDKLGH
jgi:hypothetical protein